MDQWVSRLIYCFIVKAANQHPANNLVRITEIQSNNHGSLSGNRGDNNVLGNENVRVDTRVDNHVTNFLFINQGSPSRAGDREPSDASRPYWIVPYSRNKTFTGRNSIIELVKGYCKSKDHNRVALRGLGGSGYGFNTSSLGGCTVLTSLRKTQIALEYLYQRRQESGCDVFWVNGSGVVKFSQGFRAIAQNVQIPQASAGTNEEGFLSSMKAWLEGPHSGDWILVIDNADNEDDFVNNDSPIAKFVPQGSKGTVIFTTRSLKVASRQECTVIEVGKMTDEEALELFSKRFRNWDSLEDEERKVVPMTLDSLDYLPLAVVGAAAFMTETMTHPSEYWSIFQTDDAGRKKLLLREFSDIRREADVTESILSTYFITFERITKEMPTAARLLRLIAFFDRQNIPEELLRQCGLPGIDDSIEYREAIGKLLGFSLVTYVKREGRRFYELHRLVQLSIRAYLSPEELDRWKATALRVVFRLFPRDETEWRYGGIAEAYVPHALAVAKESTDSIAVNLTYYLGRYFLHLGFYVEAEVMFRRVLERREKVLGPDHPSTLGSVNNLASVLGNLWRHGESETMFRHALEGFEKVHGPAHPDTLAGVHNLALVLKDLGRYGESETMFRHALEGFEKVLGPDHPDTLRSVNSLALVQKYLGRYGDSETMFRRVLERREKVLGPDHPNTLRSVNNLASVQQALGRYGESETILRRALEGFEKVLGPDRPDTLSSVHNLASVLKDLGRYGESETMFRRALEGREKVLGPGHPDTLRTVNNLALVLQAIERHGESETMLRCALEGHKKVLGPDHPHTLSSLHNLASVLKDQGRYGESETMLRRVLEGFEKVLGPDHPDTLRSVNSLALVLQAIERHGESETMLRRALEGFEKVLGPNHPYTLTSVNDLAGVLEDQGKYDESETMWRRVLEARETTLCPEHSKVYETLKCLAGLYETLREYSQAEEAYERACTGFSKTLGEQHPTTLECIRKLAELRETKSAAERTSVIDAEVVVDDVNNRRSLLDRLSEFMGLRW